MSLVNFVILFAQNSLNLANFLSFLQKSAVAKHFIALSTNEVCFKCQLSSQLQLFDFASFYV